MPLLKRLVALFPERLPLLAAVSMFIRREQLHHLILAPPQIIRLTLEVTRHHLCDLPHHVTLFVQLRVVRFITVCPDQNEKRSRLRRLQVRLHSLHPAQHLLDHSCTPTAAILGRQPSLRDGENVQSLRAGAETVRRTIHPLPCRVVDSRNHRAAGIGQPSPNVNPHGPVVLLHQAALTRLQRVEQTAFPGPAFANQNHLDHVHPRKTTLQVRHELNDLLGVARTHYVCWEESAQLGATVQVQLPQPRQHSNSPWKAREIRTT
mmetsp:Transcript_49880/g.118725  ORF Transcript_49880/g.118725 Transcript_49880/m.118725 type:complete len:263 (-) Transcript_49880:425-1213(-)